ncbi:sulfotransferase [Sphingomonas histidinilytica]|uniref:Sulfotransferase family protein n=1 Tax=Rhizorhabdus histidinilytica TaxID=439228 RepID=A0A1T5A673_9SPHN|nr:sulfotransferase [Rhizorhabdus histidinilytica]MBO9376244.1 sulfotransferase [Rhizorhabdus histidinilytica]SKB30512.1 Sulfotransferase family protein [Rhizorhabdus histidinilytica]
MHSRSPDIRTDNAGDGTPIDVERLFHSARIISGSFDTLDDGLRGRVEKLVSWVNGQVVMADERKEEVELQLRKLLATRLRLAADRKRIPAIADERIERPIFVIGFARTGTTLIHSLLAEDPNARAPLWWQTHDPSPPPGEVPVVPERIEYTGKELDRLVAQTPGLLTMHPYWDKRGHCLIEDEEIFTLDFQNAYPTLLYRMPALAMILDAGNAREAYGFHRQFLQHLQWNQEPKHWVVKGIYHQFVLEELFEAYPDALCIWPHRDPVEVHPSTMAITAVLYGAITNWQMDFRELGPAFVQGIAQSVAQAIESPFADDPRILHVDFRELVRDPIAIVRKAYGQWGLDYGPEFEARMKAWLADPTNAPDRYGRYRYTMEPYGLTREMIESAFEGYCRRFGLGKFA